MGKRILLLLSVIIFSTSSLFSQKSEIVYLSGKGTDDAVEWDFYCTGGNNSGYWTKIPVPSNWELQGFGNYNYGHDKEKSDEQGLYRHNFKAPREWKGKKVEIVFEASMTDTRVQINGKQAGPVHQGGFYRFSYDISDLVKYGKENLLEVTVSKMSSNESVNQAERKADYWVFGGIFRPVFLRAKPEEHIERYAVDARANGDLNLEVYTSETRKADRLRIRIYPAGKDQAIHSFSQALQGGKKQHLVNTTVKEINTWNPEFPHLYTLQLELMDGDKLLHEENEKIGFRTVEVKPEDGIYVNGKKILFKGVCRHSFWPSSGRALNKTLSIADVELMKNMNMNAVRMSHYPPDPHFLDVCDSLGLFVLNELAGWQKPPYDTEIGKKLVREMVTRDVNHPSILIWDNGNEGGWNTDLDDEFAKYDPQKRLVIHPWELFNDMNTQHYISWNYGHNVCFNGRDIYFPTEFLHGLYDGGHGAGLEDYYSLMLQRPQAAGGFLWDFADEGVVRTDKNGIIDTDGNHAADGIVGPYREKEGSYYTIREIWCPVNFEMQNIPPAFDGRLRVLNLYTWTNLNQCSFEAELSSPLPASSNPPGKSWNLQSPSVEPGNKGFIDLELPSDWRKHQVLSLTAIDPHGREIMEWAWPVKSPSDMAGELVHKNGKMTPEIIEEDEHFVMKTSNNRFVIDKSTGMISSVIHAGKEVPFANGPALAHSEAELKEISYSVDDGKAEVKAVYDKGFSEIKWTLYPSGWLQLDYEFNMKGEHEYAGINFTYPEEKVKSVTYMGDGPYRVWKNRMKGPQFGLWEKKYNNTITGESWEYPEFKGYYSRMFYAGMNTDEVPVTFVSASEDIFLKLFTPEEPKGAYNTNTSPPFPDGDISFLHAISPIGTKFRPAEKTGPQGELNKINGKQPFRGGTIYFLFGKEVE